MAVDWVTIGNIIASELLLLETHKFDVGLCQVMVLVIIFAQMHPTQILIKQSWLDLLPLHYVLSLRQWQHIRQVFNKLRNFRELE
jgi:hypothetical protein